MAVGIIRQRPVLMIADLIETIQIDSNGTTLDGNGYSTTGNYGDDGICDSTYTPYGNNIDYLPLTSNLASVTINLVSIGGSAGTPMTRIPGDVNFDCKIDLKDLLFMRRYLSGLEPLI